MSTALFHKPRRQATDDPDRDVLLAFTRIAEALGFAHEGPDSRDLAFGVMAYTEQWEVGLGSPYELQREAGKHVWYVAIDIPHDGRNDVREFHSSDAAAALACAVSALLLGSLR